MASLAGNVLIGKFNRRRKQSGGGYGLASSLPRSLCSMAVAMDSVAAIQPLFPLYTWHAVNSSAEMRLVKRSSSDLGQIFGQRNETQPFRDAVLGSTFGSSPSKHAEQHLD